MSSAIDPSSKSSAGGSSRCKCSVDSCPAKSTKEPTSHLRKPVNKALLTILAEVPSWWERWAFPLQLSVMMVTYFIILTVEREQRLETWPDQEATGNEVTLSLKQVPGIAG